MSDAATEEPHRIIEESAPATKGEIEKKEAVQEFSKEKTKTGDGSMQVKVHSPFKTYFDGPAFSISGENATGPFDILPGHHNFLTLLDPCELVVRSTKDDEKIQINGGLMHVKADEVVVFLDV